MEDGAPLDEVQVARELDHLLEAAERWGADVSTVVRVVDRWRKWLTR